MATHNVQTAKHATLTALAVLVASAFGTTAPTVGSIAVQVR